MMNLFTQLDENTMKHSNRVGDLSAELANLLGFTSENPR